MLKLPKVTDLLGLNHYPVFYWNHVGLQMNRITHSLGGPQGGPTMSSRALGLLHLAMHDAFLGALGHTRTSEPPPYLPDAVMASLVAAVPTYPGHGTPVKPGDLDHANRALTGAAMAMLDHLYSGDHPSISIVASDTLTRALTTMMGEYHGEIDILHPAHGLGVAVARHIHGLLAVKPGEPGADAGRYEPHPGPYYFRDEPVTPVRPGLVDPNDPSRGEVAVRVYHGPLYGLTVRDFAVHHPADHRIADWPDPRKGDTEKAAYLSALREVVALGGAAGTPKTTRTPEGTVIAYYWAYDGANLIGTPPRLYNQILREVIWSKRDVTATPLVMSTEFVRTLALANVAMGDAGKYAWYEKYRFELWRPLSGVREHVDEAGMHDADPFWLALGAPETNTNRVSFKPPFPAYPSGHATFGAAAFQMLRLYYASRDGDPAQVTAKLEADGFQEPDTLEFAFVSDELDGISRDLRQPYDAGAPIEDQQGVVRTRIEKKYGSLWHAIFDNAFSRIYLGVHWHFDAAAATDIYSDTTQHPPVLNAPADITYAHAWRPERGDVRPVGGVPLGLGIANDIFYNRMTQPGATPAATVTSPLTDTPSKRSNTTYRQSSR